MIIVDDDLSEFEEMFETYTDTWGKSVRKEIVKNYSNNEQQIIQLSPDFEAIELIPEKPEDITDGPKPIFDEAFNLKKILMLR